VKDDREEENARVRGLSAETSWRPPGGAESSAVLLQVHVAQAFMPAEMVSTGKGLLSRVASGARNHLQANRSLQFQFEVMV
jgi:hypothetical protein